MDTITIGQIAAAVAFLVAIIGGIGYLVKSLKKWILAMLGNEFGSIKTEITGLYKRLDEVDMESCKNFLVKYLADAESGKQIDEIEKERFFEQYQHYLKLGGNSYIKHKAVSLYGNQDDFKSIA